jgi:hypothetical protein
MSETLRQQATQGGLVPLKAWVKNALDHVIQEWMNEPGLEFVWVGDDAIDPLEQAQTDFSAEQLLYLPRNARAHRLYGMRPVGQIALTVNIALRRDASTLDYYRAASSPDAFATCPRNGRPTRSARSRTISTR